MNITNLTDGKVVLRGTTDLILNAMETKSVEESEWLFIWSNDRFARLAVQERIIEVSDGVYTPPTLNDYTKKGRYEYANNFGDIPSIYSGFIIVDVGTERITQFAVDSNNSCYRRSKEILGDWSVWISSSGGGVLASDVSVVDEGSFFTGDNVESVLQEIGGDIETALDAIIGGA